MKNIQQNEKPSYRPLDYETCIQHIQKIYPNAEISFSDVSSIRFDVLEKKCFLSYSSLLVKSQGHFVKWPIQPYTTEFDFEQGVEILTKEKS